MKLRDERNFSDFLFISLKKNIGEDDAHVFLGKKLRVGLTVHRVQENVVHSYIKDKKVKIITQKVHGLFSNVPMLRILK